MNEMMTFPNTWEEYEKSYGFTDSEEVYTNGARLIPSFRVKQWLDHLPSVRPELANNSPKLDKEIGELISRQAAIDALDKRFDSVPMEQTTEILMLRKDLRELPSSQPRRGKWIRTRTMTHDGELYCDQCEQEYPEQKIIWNFCPNCGCRMEEGDSE